MTGVLALVGRVRNPEQDLPQPIGDRPPGVRAEEAAEADKDAGVGAGRHDPLDRERQAHLGVADGVLNRRRLRRGASVDRHALDHGASNRAGPLDGAIRAGHWPAGLSLHHLAGDALSLTLASVARLADRAGRASAAGRLLDHMGQLVGQQQPARGGRRLVLRAAEEDVAADGVGVRMQPLGRLCGVAIGVDPNVAEVCAEPRLHERAGCGVERLAGAGALHQARSVRFVVPRARPGRACRSGMAIAAPLDQAGWWRRCRCCAGG